MSAFRAVGTVLLVACAAFGSFGATTVLAQGEQTHEVRKGDTLFGVTRKTKHDGVTRNQMILAIFRANRNAFPGGNVNVLEVGTILTIPRREVVAAIVATEADREVRELLAAAKPAAALPPTAALRPPAALAAPSRPTLRPSGPDEAARRYQEGIAMERRGDAQGAFKAFTEAAEGGHGLAQRKLGQIYDKGNTVVQRDFQASLYWYQKAREQGVEIDKPLQRTTPR